MVHSVLWGTPVGIYGLSGHYGRIQGLRQSNTFHTSYMAVLGVLMYCVLCISCTSQADPFLYTIHTYTLTVT
jgi:hypothetical protein